MSENQVLTGLSKLKRELADLKSHILEVEEFASRLDLEAPAQEVHPPSPARRNLALSEVASFASRAEAAADQAAVLSTLVQTTSELCGTSLLMVENDRQGYSPWKSGGFDSDRWQNILIGRDDPVARGAREQQILLFDWQTGSVPDALASLESQGKAAAVPLVFGERVPAILYVGSSTDLDLDSVRLIIELARLYIQNRSLTAQAAGKPAAEVSEPRWPKLEALVPPPPTETAAQQPLPEPEPAAQPERAEFETQAHPPPPAASPPQETAPDTEEFSDAYELETLADVKPEELGMSEEEFARLMGSASSDWKVPESAARQEPEEPEAGAMAGPAPEADPEAGEAEAEATPEEETQPERMAEEPAVSSPPAAAEEAIHVEARRFARLLVAEIKLYNEEEVQTGRQAGDLYRRLKADIDRSREMYEKRAASLVRASEDYFHSEMVRVLAQENAELMGPDYPGPQLETAP